MLLSRLVRPELSKPFPKAVLNRGGVIVWRMLTLNYRGTRLTYVSYLRHTANQLQPDRELAGLEQFHFPSA